MTRTYRACYYQSPDGQGETVLTGPEDAHLDDDALMAEAVAEAERGGIIYPDDYADRPGPSHQELVDGLRIGEWTESGWHAVEEI